MLSLSKDNLSIKDLGMGDFVRCRFSYLYSVDTNIAYMSAGENYAAIYVGTSVDIIYSYINRFYFYVLTKNGLDLHYAFSEHIKDITLLC